MIRLEHETGVMIITFRELSEKVNSELTIMKAGFSEMSEQVKGELAIMKTEFDTVKESVKEQNTSNLTNLEKGLQKIKEDISEQQVQASKLIAGEMDKLQAKLVDIQGTDNNAFVDFFLCCWLRLLGNLITCYAMQTTLSNQICVHVSWNMAFYGL